MAGKYKETSAELLRRLALGESLRSICRDPKMPRESTVYGWRMPGHRLFKPGFADKLAAARLMQREALMDRLLDVAREEGISEARRKAEMDALKTVASRLESKVGGKVGEVSVRVVYED